jgi:hypothetical protein
MGGDAAGVAGLDLCIRKDPKVFFNRDFLIGFTSSFRMGQILQYRFEPPAHDPVVPVDTYMRTSFIDAVRKVLEDCGNMRKVNDEEYAGTFLVGYRGRLFCIENDFQVGECVYPFNAVGCGSEVAKGVIHALLETDILDDDKVRKALSITSEHNAGVRPPFTILSLPSPAKQA